MYKVRLIENIFENHVAEFTLTEKMTVGQIRELLKLDNQAKFFQNGRELKDSQTPKEGSFTIKLIPGTFTTAVAIISVVIAISAVVIGLVALSNLNNTKFPNLSGSNASLRGSTNNARKSERLPLLLGKHRVYPDVAALPFSSYQDHNQYLHQLFCFSYSDVVIDYSTLKIGETLISYYEDCTYNVGLGNIYPSRVVENVYQLQLKNDGSSSPIVRSTASACKKIEVGLMAPNGIYKYEGEDRKSLSVGIKIEWRVPDGSWKTAYAETLSLNTDKWRKMYSITPSGSTDGIYEVRVQRTTQESEELQVSDSLYLDVIKSFVGLDDDSSIPVTSDNLQLVSLKTKATDQLNGVIDSFNAICTLKTRSWDGLGTGASHWTEKETRNPASAILYLLTNSNANAEPVEDSLIDWPSFEEFYQFCEDYGFNCDAWVTTEYTVLQLCEFIAASNMAEMVIQCDKISIRAEKAQESVVQLFTPRNAWDFEMIRSFESKPKNITVNFDDETKGYVQVERKVALDDGGSIVFDSEVEGDSLTIDSFGVTSATQAARLGAQKLKLLYSQTRKYSWKSDIEGIFCLPGDVVLIENDNFLLGLGEGRIKKIIYNNSKITGIKLDARMKMVSGSSYGVRIRTSSAVLESIPVITVAGEDWTLTFKNPQENSIGINVGDLVAFGEFKTESHKVLITDITPDQNRSCSFKGVDYSDDAYSQELTIPSYDSGLSVYPSDGGKVGASGQISVPRYVVYGTKGEKGDRGDSIIVQYAYSTSPTECFGDTLSWNNANIYWGKEQGIWNWWTDTQLEEKNGYFIWMRTKVGNGDWVYTRLTGTQGKQGIQGETGEKGETGAQGIQGEKGEKGEKGDTGETGAQGPQGEKGDTGAKGDPARTYVSLTSGYDLNSCTAKDTVYVSSSTAICNSLLNKPSTFVAGEVRVEVEWLGSNNYFIQYLYCKAGSTTRYYSRAYSSGTWGSWVELGTKGEDGTPAKVCLLSCDKSAITKNNRSTDSQTYTFTINVQGYSVAPTLTINGTSVTLTQTGTAYAYAYSMPLKNASSITAIAYIDGTQMDNLTLGVIDDTGEPKYFGTLSELPTDNSTYISGDSCVFNKLVYIYNGSDWQKSTESTLSNAEKASALSLAMKDVLNGIDKDTLTASEYAFFENVIARIVTADYVGALTIVLQKGGYIKSEGYSSDNSTGFYLSADGVLNAQGGVFSDVTVKGGRIISDSFETSNVLETNTIDDSYGKSNPAWKGIDVYTFLFNQFGNTETEATIQWQDETYNKFLVYSETSEGETFYIIEMNGTTKRLVTLSSSTSSYKEDNFQIKYNGSIILQVGTSYNSWVGVTDKYYAFRWFKKASGRIIDGTWAGLSVATSSYTLYTLNSTTSSLQIIVQNIATGGIVLYVYDAGKYYKNANYNITYVTKEIGAYVSSLYPLEPNVSDIGAINQQFDVAYINNVKGNLTGNVKGNVEGAITGNVTGNLTGNVIGNVTGNTIGEHTGNVNLASGTQYKVFGAVFN